MNLLQKEASEPFETLDMFQVTEDTKTTNNISIKEKTIKVSEVVYREDLYPRIQASPELIQRYSENIDVMPPIEINQHNILIDGFHRWTAHKKLEKEFIKAIITETKSENELFGIAILKNSTHGMQMSEKDKKKSAIRLYGGGEGISKKEIAKILSVTERTINGYLHDIDEQLRKERKETIYKMWLSCHTQEEIAEAVKLSQVQIVEIIKELSVLETLPKAIKLQFSFQDAEFNPPLYNIWSFGKKTNGTSHFGNTEQRIVENLLYLYTEPFDIVLDPFAGGGSTIDVCKKRGRRYFVSDRKPIIERENEIRLLDICKEFPSLGNRWSDVTLTYLDPPYWKQAENKYSTDAEDLANMNLEEFTKNLSDIVKNVSKKQSKGVIALIIQPTQWKNEDKKVTDHIIDLIKAVGNKRLELQARISCPYSSEQCTPQQVEWAKENKKLLVLTRELIVWRIVKE